jgi:hypothetical protein
MQGLPDRVNTPVIAERPSRGNPARRPGGTLRRIVPDVGGEAL